MSGALKSTTALAAKGLPFEVSGDARAAIPIARRMVRVLGIRGDPFDVPVVPKRSARAPSDPTPPTTETTNWRLDRFWALCSMENIVPLSFLCVVALVLAYRFRGRRKEATLTGVLSPPYGSYFSTSARLDDGSF
jgi:hypothetical protein